MAPVSLLWSMVLVSFEFLGNWHKAIHAREGIDLSRQTMIICVIQLREWLSLLMVAMKRLLYQVKVIHIDETRLQVLNETGRKKTQLSYM